MFRSKKRVTRVTVIRDIEQVKMAVNSRHLAAVDQFCVQAFSLNASGWPRNTISSLARCQTMEQYKMLADRLVKMPLITDKNMRDVPLKDRFALIRPRYAQTPQEMEALAEQLADYDMNAINTKVAAAVVKQQNSSRVALDAPSAGSDGPTK